MKYEYELAPLIEWIRANPGNTSNRLAQSIASVPWPLRLDEKYPATDSLTWKLRYLELAGIVESIGGKWRVIK